LEEGTFMSTETIVVGAADYETCPVTRLLRRIGDKWSPAVIMLLATRAHGFNELDRSIEGISRRMLTRTLRALEEDGLVSRTPQASTRVEYALTPLGQSLREQLSALGQWAASHDRVSLPDKSDSDHRDHVVEPHEVIDVAGVER
jgi:DNA-binding HxlR family transcriptional regulator